MTGIFELVELEGPRAGTRHRIMVYDGKVSEVETPLDAGDGRGRLRDRLESVFAISDARLTFRVARSGRGLLADALGPGDYLRGRPRARDRGQAAPRRRAEPPSEQVRALATLGLAGAASHEQIKRAFRCRARELHPDRHPGATLEMRADMMRRFSVLSAAYHTLITRSQALDAPPERTGTG